MTITKDSPYEALSKEEVVELAEGILENKIYTSDHVHAKDEKNLSSIFVPLASVGQEFWDWVEARNIAMIYADKRKRNSSASYFNGYPVFFEMRCIDENDKKRVWDLCTKLRRKR